eukprot:COSAG01_NODE_5164_length_4440_cov_5.051601_1_plen_58_part_00
MSGEPPDLTEWIPEALKPSLEQLAWRARHPLHDVEAVSLAAAQAQLQDLRFSLGHRH